MSPPLLAPDTNVRVLARRAMRAALAFLAVVAVLGALLRGSQVWPIEGFAYANWLHAHSHTAFLGFVFNAFFGIALAVFAPADATRGWERLFVVLQIAVLGMLASFPAQGYGAVSIAFSTLHLASVGLFAWRLWRDNRAAPAARGHLRAALGFLVASGLGPLALGPLAALELRDSPAYALSIFFYVHAHGQGWFLFFLQALALQQAAGFVAPAAAAGFERDAARALRWLLAGVVLTYAQSALWLDPPAWVRAVAALGGVAQLAGFGFLLRALRVATQGAGTSSATLRALIALGLGAFALKLLLQTVAAWPALAPLVNHRFVVIAFLHLVFLGVVAPAIFAWALHAGWLRDSRVTRAGLVLFFVAAAISELVLVGVALGWSLPAPLAETLFATAALMAAGATLIAAEAAPP